MTSPARMTGFLASVTTLMLAGLVSAGDWSQWHGPNRDNLSTETGLLKEWPAGGPSLVWKATGLGGGYGGPAIAKGRVYLGGYVGEDDVIWALDEATGKAVWTTKAGPAVKNFDRADGPRATPTVDGDRLYMLGGGGRLICLDTTGKEVWRKELVADLGGRMMSGWGFSESPLVDGDLVVCTPGSLKGTVAAFNKRNGTVVWQSGDFTDKAAYASITIATLAGIRQYVVFTDQNVAGISPTDGKVLWKAARPGRTAVVPTPITAQDHVFVTSGYGIGCNLFKVSGAGGTLSAEQVYANTDLVNHHGGVVLIGDHLYGHSDSKGWVCMELKSGKLVWADRGVGKGAVTFADGHLYCRSEGSAGTVALVEATPKGYVEKGRFDQPERSKKNSWPHPVVANGRLYLRDQDLLLCYRVKP